MYREVLKYDLVGLDVVCLFASTFAYILLLQDVPLVVNKGLPQCSFLGCICIE